ncbi:MAG: hypothetical protein H6767_07260 [Candidatus Peribacteria bacterium]|nr:MAG: hypothetical protein H6767_07260 [Candidatus Peribacteria bacterium]
MAGEQTPLQREVSESKGTPESIRTETLRVLEQAQEILRIAEERGENVEEIRKEYKDVEQATIAALKNIRFDGRQARSEVSDDLSDGSIDEGEMGVIKDEYDEFFNLNLQAQTQVRTKEV